MIDSVAAAKALESLKSMNLDREELKALIPPLTIVVDEILAKASMDNDVWHQAWDAKMDINQRLYYSDPNESEIRSSAKTFCRVLNTPQAQDCF